MALTEAMADECAGRGLRFNAVLPTIIDTPANHADARCRQFGLGEPAGGGQGHRLPALGRIETPFRMSATPGVIASRAPLLGEHTDMVMAELGYDAGRIADLRQRAII